MKIVKSSWFSHISWLVISVLAMTLIVYLQPEDSLFNNVIDPVRLVWKLILVLNAAWIAYHLARTILPRQFKLDILYNELSNFQKDDREYYSITAIICAVIIGRLLFMGIVALAVASGV